MDTNMQARLERLRNYATRYEIVATNMDDDRKILAGYTSRKNRSGLLAMIRQHAEKWQHFAGANHMVLGKRAADPIVLGVWRLNFSGRTQREAIISGEHAFIVDEVSKVLCPVGGDPPGCGSWKVSQPDAEGFRDCLNCGLFFKDSEVKRAA